MTIAPSAYIDPTSRVDSSAVLEEEVYIGPWCLVGPSVRLGKRVRLESNVVIECNTIIGADTHVFPFAVLATPPQHFRYRGLGTSVEIGEKCTLREYTNVQRGTEGDKRVTRLGNQCYIMGYVHVAHDCDIGDRVTITNGVQIAGHVSIGQGAVIGGNAGVHQHVRIGDLAMIGGVNPVLYDVIPFGMIGHRSGFLRGINRRGMVRNQFTSHDIRRVYKAVKFLFDPQGTLTFRERKERFCQENQADPTLRTIVRFLEGDSVRGYTRPRIEDSFLGQKENGDKL